jgi:zinc D-Ala-D-Ala carboxypeptidase
MSKSIKVSKYFSLSEFVKSAKAIKHKIDNTPPAKIIENIKFFAVTCMDLVRELFGVPITPSSGYRCPALNKIVKGSITSDHLTGLAADFNVPGYTVRQAIAKIVSSGIDFDQLICEYDTWVHISKRYHNNRKQILLFAIDKFGKTHRRVISKEEALSWAKAV